MRSINPYKFCRSPHRNFQSCNAPPYTLSHRLSLIGGGQ
ncbi:hypothetical protein PS662_01187 [Pseudomonas fluorescens]|uniref:Uncharacterized protein n=1 Tax=Pseudomonas fluorescens TaxID=294 RepID=A0A5E6QTD2_PSEFL|nr:hypothetical protein PS662_01187 [Pseudomonas fluorescens]